jgi:hypothetical protein
MINSTIKALLFLVLVASTVAAQEPTIWNIQKEVATTYDSGGIFLDDEPDEFVAAYNFAAVAGFREWVNSTRRFRTRARYLDHDESRVLLEKESGKTKWVPIRLLSFTSRENLKKIIATKGPMIEVYRELKAEASLTTE